jgi:TnpA family transposase
MNEDADLDAFWETWGLTRAELDFVMDKPARIRLGYAAQLKIYMSRGQFPERTSEIPATAAAYLAEQLGAGIDDLDAYDWSGRTGRRHRGEVLAHLGLGRFGAKDRAVLARWLESDVCRSGATTTSMAASVYGWCKARGVASPAAGETDRIVRSARRAFEDAFFQRVAAALGDDAVEAMEKSLEEPDAPGGFHDLKADPGGVSLDSLLKTAARLTSIRELRLPPSALTGVSENFLERFRRRVDQESAREFRRHPPARRLGMYAVFLAAREQTVTDSLVDLLIETVHKMAKRAERKVVKRVAQDIVKVHGKERLLYRIAEAAIAFPDKTVREVVFPIAGAEKLEAVVGEYKSVASYNKQVHEFLRSSYGGHYRRMLPKLLALLQFRSNNAAHRPVLTALEWLKATLETDSPQRIIRSDDDIPVDDVVPPKWRDAIKEIDGEGAWRIQRIDYEVCVLRALRERLRCKEIWVVGADRYRNPDEDLPQDFDARRADYYNQLGQTQDAAAFVKKLRSDLKKALLRFNATVPRNPYVRLLERGKNRISLTPLAPLPSPVALEALKAELERRWAGTSLLDVLKEAALQTGFLDEFKTSGDRVVLDPLVLQRRQLLCLFGLGTNAGLKRVCSAQDGVSYAELLHVRRRFITKESLRSAVVTVTNAILTARDRAIWGEGTSSCASDSKKFGAWDQNLMAEWHVRYGGRGVMIYWHVERRSACIHSQLKRCSSSEVAAMIEGVLRHCTDAEVQRQYVDSHGQSEVAFAFCHLLGFDLAPRLKAIARQRLYVPDLELKEGLTNLTSILTRAINWDVIEQQYDEMIKHASGLRCQTADPETILRRFTTSNVQHPTYAALAELGKVIKTIFLCRYLAEEPFRREINAGLNVVENWNSANGFIFFGKGGEISSNRLQDQEMSVFALHLLQNSLVYVNTLMLQQILAEPAWRNRMTPEDWRALSPLLYPHVNPYGQFDLDLDDRIDFEQKLAA